jgi:hypothetical protein
VKNWIGIQSKVSEPSHALKSVPGEVLKYGVPEEAVAPLIGGRSTRYRPGLVAAIDPSAELAPGIDGDGERGLAQEGLRVVQVLHLDAVVGVDPLTIRNAERVRAEVLVRGQREPPVRPPRDLEPDARSAVELPVGLPAVHDPRLDLQLVAGEDLYPHAVEEPWRVRGHVRGLIRPVVELVVAEEPHVGQEDAGVDVDAIEPVEVIAAVGLGDVAERVGEVPLSAGGAGVVVVCEYIPNCVISRARTPFQWKSPPTPSIVSCTSSWRKTSLEPEIVLSAGRLKL